MTIWVDADACPKAAKEILYRAAHQRQIQLILVANQFLAVPASPFIKAVQVESGFDVADNYIVSESHAGDLVITSDIPLAAEVIAKDVQVIDARGKVHSKETIGARLNMRDFMETMRSSGVVMQDGPAAYSQQDKQSFANALDRYIHQTKTHRH